MRINDLRPYGDEYHYSVSHPGYLGCWAHWQKVGCVRMILSIIRKDGTGYIVPVHYYGHDEVATIVHSFGSFPEGFNGPHKTLPFYKMEECLEKVAARLSQEAVKKNIEFLRSVYIDEHLHKTGPFTYPYNWYAVRPLDWCMLAEVEGIAWNRVGGGKIEWCNPKDCITDRKLSLAEFREGVQAAIAICKEAVNAS